MMELSTSYPQAAVDNILDRQDNPPGGGNNAS